MRLWGSAELQVLGTLAANSAAASTNAEVSNCEDQKKGPRFRSVSTNYAYYKTFALFVIQMIEDSLVIRERFLTRSKTGSCFTTSW